MTFSASHESTLDTLHATLAEQNIERRKLLPPAEAERLEAHVAGLGECVAVALVFFHGFNDIVVAGENAHGVTPELRRWVTSVPRHQSGTRLAGMTASSLCAVLEDYIVDTCRNRLSPTTLAQLRAVDATLQPDDAKAIGQLLKRVKPSARTDGSTWINALRLVFGVVLTTEESDTLIDLLTFRNKYIHDPRSAFAQSITGEHMKCWTVSATILCRRIALACI